MYVDSHAHLNDSQFKNDYEEVIKRAFENEVSHIIINGYDLESSALALDIASRFDNVYATAGIHPNDANKFDEHTIDKLRELASNSKVVAIGEIGLDYYYTKEDMELQKSVFKKQIELAIELDLPITIHSRDAINDTYNILSEYNHYGVMHCYSSSAEEAVRFVKLGYYISLAGPVTFKNGRVAKEVAKAVSLDNLLIETDCPYLAPTPYRGKRNEPSYVKHVAEAIAECKEVDLKEVAEFTTQNAKKLFKIK